MNQARRRIVLVYTAVLVLLCLFLAQRGLYKGGLFEAGRVNDFQAYHLAAKGVWERDLDAAYRDQVRPYQYPPPFAVLLSPLGLLPYRGALVVWVLLKLGIVCLAFRGLGWILALPLSAEAKLGGFLLVFRLIEGDFANGNANVVLLGILLLGFALGRRGSPWGQGGFLGVAALTKVSPGAVIFWIVYRARWKMLAAFLGGGLLFGSALPALALGPERALLAWNTWFETTVAPARPGTPSYQEEPGHGYMPGQGLRAFLHRTLRDSDATAHDDAIISIHCLDLPKEVVDGIYVGLCAVVLAILLWGSWTRAAGRCLSWRPEEIAAALVAMAILGPLSRKAHFVLLWPAAVLAFDAWWKCSDRRWRLIGAVVWGLALVLVVGTSPGVLGRELATLALAYCPLLWAGVALLFLVTWPRFYPRTLRGDAVGERGSGGAGRVG